MGPKHEAFGFVLDLVVLLPGWLILFAIEPLAATFIGLPIGAISVGIRRLVWSRYQISGRCAAAVISPSLSLCIFDLLYRGVSSPMLGFIPALLVMGAIDIGFRVRASSLLKLYPMLSTVLFLGITTLFSHMFFDDNIQRSRIEDLTMAASRCPAPPAWNESARKETLDVVRAVINNRSRTEHGLVQLHAELKKTAPNLAESAAPRGIHVTFFDASGLRSQAVSYESDAFTALFHASVNALEEAASPLGDSPRVQIDVPGFSRTVFLRTQLHKILDRHRSLESSGLLGIYYPLAYEIEPGIHGLIVEGPGFTVYMMPDEPIIKGWLTPSPRGAGAGQLRAMIRHLWLDRRGVEVDLLAPSLSFRKFRVASFSARIDRGEIVDHVRGNTLINGELTQNRLEKRIIAACKWLARQVSQTGRFHYEMMPPRRQSTNNYAMARHSASTYVLLHYYHISLTRPALASSGETALEAGINALLFIKDHLVDHDADDSIEELCFTDPKTMEANSGATALAAMAYSLVPSASSFSDPALAEEIRSLNAREQLHKINECILAMVDDEGAVFTTRKLAAESDRVVSEHRFFPGETMLSLVISHNATGDPRLLQAAKKIGDRQLSLSHWSTTLGFSQDGDHWFTQAMSELARATGEEKYAELSILYGRGFIRYQCPPTGNLFADYRGAYRCSSYATTNRTASRGEAVGAAMRAARFLGEDTTEFEIALMEGARHLIEQQFSEDNAHFISDDWDVIGAIRMGLVDNHVRIDNNQHAIIALLNALDAIDSLTE
ncbi:MAG: hypothetical protein GY847_31150 [Proteobacteria bacterium]|nr:hypothetical protein [Pseudomonadota bacterium]